MTLPKETFHLLNKVSEKGDRSRLINSAVRFYVNEIGKANIKKNLREGAAKRKERDLALTEDWFCVENDLWQKNRK